MRAQAISRGQYAAMTSHSPWHHHPGVRSGTELSLGERSADRMRGIMGSWPFVFGFFAVMIIWAGLNTFVLGRALHRRSFDPYPYILLNLFLSMLAGVQAAALLIAAKRADSVSAEIALHTERTTDDIKTLLAENTDLTEQIKTNTDLLEEIHRHLRAMAPESEVASDVEVASEVEVEREAAP